MNQISCLIAAIGISASGARDAAPDPYALLARVPSPYELIRLPGAYRAHVELSGPVADEMRAMLAKMNLSPPRFEEIMGKDKRLSLRIANSDYPLETRNLISGILNPTEMIDLLLCSLLRYRDQDKFARIKQETTAQLTREHGPYGPALLVALTPRGNRFAYAYEDAGAAVHESWLAGLDVLLDSASLRVCRIVLTRCSKTVSALQAEAPQTDTAVMQYAFEYDSVNGAPTRLALSVNGKPAVTVEATYRNERGSMVFDQRRICCRLPRGEAEWSCLNMRYGAYTLGSAAAAGPPVGENHPTKTAYAKRVAKAATLTRKALEDLRRGNISQAARTLRKLIESYPQTPQAIEAEKLLSGLP